MARRFNKSKVAPDMGWVVGRSLINLGGVAENSRTDFLFDFADIDPEATTGRIEADKSDWFIKRVLADIHCTANLPGLDQNDCVRMVMLGISTCGVENANAIVGSAFPVFGPEWYNLQSRVIQTWTMPAYHFGQIPYYVANPSNNIGVGITPINQAVDADTAGYANQTAWFGPARKEIDIQVSNAGLRNNQGFMLTASAYNLTGLAWESDDDVWVHIAYRVLMQKRR